MAIVHQLRFFSWKDLQNDLNSLADLERLKLVIETLPDGRLIDALKTRRGRGRKDHPLEAIWIQFWLAFAG